MGYESTLYIVQLAGTQREWKYDQNNRAVKDDEGNIVYSGRDEVFMMKRAMVEMFKIGDTSLYQLFYKHLNRFKEADKVATTRTVHMWYHSDGDTRCLSDRYDDPLVPIPLDEVLAAARQDVADSADPWYPIVMLVSMLETMEKMKLLKNHHAVFYGH